MEGTLIDASKILDVAKSQLEASMEHGAPDPKKAHDILHSAVENFSIYNTQDAFGLLLLLDHRGRLFARSGEYPTKPFDLSDRNYYLDLRDHPSREFAVGRLRKAATTGRIVFHLSMPVHRSDKSFAGVVAVQLDEVELASKLAGMLGSNQGKRMLVLIPDGRTLFAYPSPAEPPSGNEAINNTLLALSLKSSSTRSTVRIAAGTPGFSEACIASFERNSLFGFITWSCITESEVFSLFLKQNLPLIIFSVLAIVGIGSLFIGLYRQARHLEKAVHLATSDPSTGLPNRRALEIRAATLWKEAFHQNKPITVLFFDIDRFKEFNDFWGHQTGDRVLKLIAGLLRKCTDRPFDFFCRWGGEEFLILLPETGTKGAIAIAQRIRKALAGIRLKSGGTRLPPVTISIGIASTECRSASSLQDLIERADRRMLQAKSSGRDRIVSEAIEEKALATG